MSYTIEVRGLRFTSISGYMNYSFSDKISRRTNDNTRGYTFFLSHTPQLILHYFPDLGINEVLKVYTYYKDGSLATVHECKPLAKGYDYSKAPFRLKDFDLEITNCLKNALQTYPE